MTNENENHGNEEDWWTFDTTINSKIGKPMEK